MFFELVLYVLLRKPIERLF